MKRIAWICITTVMLSLFTSCTRRMEQLPDGLKGNSTGTEEKSAVGEKAEKYEIQSQNHEELDNMDSATVQQKVPLFFWDKDGNKLVSENRTLFFIKGEMVLDEIVDALIKGPNSENLKPVLPNSTKILKVEQAENIVTVNLSSDFLKADNLLAARVALVNTLTEQEGVKYVKIYVEDKELTADGTANGEALGILSKSSNSLDELAATEKREVAPDATKRIDRELYFADFRSEYLLPEVRTLAVKNGQIIRGIVEELIKGPIVAEKGLYPTLPSGIQLLKADVEKGSDGVPDTAILYFSRELKAFFEINSASRGVDRDKTKVQQMKNKESILISSLVYSITALPNIGAVKIFYQNKDGEYIDDSLYTISIRKPLSRDDFPHKQGRKIKVYFGDMNAMHLVPEYRAMPKDSLQIATTIINELVRGPQEKSGHSQVIPTGIVVGDIKVRMDSDSGTAIVDLPSKLDGNQMGSTGVLMTLYAIVNSLTDSTNTRNIRQVQFLIDGKSVKTFGNMELSEPFIRNPAIIQE